MAEYTDFELLIERTESGYRARVLASPAGTGAGPFFDLSPNGEPQELRTFAGCGSGETRNVRVIPSSGEVTIESLGRRLFQSVFAGPVLGLWHRSLGKAGNQLRLRIRLEDDPHLLNVPWELLDDPDRGIVATERPVVRSIEGPIVPRPISMRPPLRILAVLSCPPALPQLDIDKEWHILDRMLGALVANEQVVMEKLVQPTSERIRQALRAEEWQVLHFVGHGLSGGLFLGDPNGEASPVDHETVGVLFLQDSLRLVVLNACEGACPGTSDPFSGVAQTLIKRGVPAVVAMQRQVSDKTAISFAEHFYRGLARRLPIDAALMEARKELRGQNDPEWPVPVLYLSAPAGDLVKPPVPYKFFPGRRFWVLAALAVLGALLAAFALGRWGSFVEPPPPDVLPPNPPECPSPAGLDMSFVKIKPGIFRMGEEKGDANDEPVHAVSIKQEFCLGTLEVTQEQWDKIVGRGIETPTEERNLPARSITFDAAQDFIARLNAQDTSDPYRLPTEAEWEYAARAGTSTRYSFGDDPKLLPFFANCKGRDNFDGPAPGRSFRPNGFGLYDMYGNVFEWVSDWYGDYSGESQVDPFGPLQGTKRIRRGGSWDSSAKACSSAVRSIVQPNWSDKYTGFRIVREIH
jgi:formylglycine-generating enzyme required for sulfatase activity